jgi:hypothetical protein
MQLDPRFIKVAHDPGDPVLCSHCPFCGSGQITGRSDGGIDCAFCGQSFIVRVQPAFPGMPQAPGMGAPTDVGPDMGAMPPPGMEGGMPGEEMPPGMEGGEGEGFPPGEDEEGGPPFGDEEQEEGETPEEGEEEEDEGEGGKPPPFTKKKSARTAAMRHEDMSSAQLRQHMREQHGYQDSPDDPDWLIEQAHRDDHADDPYHSHHHPDFEEEQPDLDPGDRDWLGGHGITGRRYRTISGDLLPEDAYVRHLAILFSGRSPAVLARVRREAYLTTGDTPEHRAHYDRGYSASENHASYRGEYSPLEEADLRGEPDSWYQGYMDHATDRPYGHAIECPAHDHDAPGCTLHDQPERYDPAYVRQRDTTWLGEHRIQGSRNGSVNHRQAGAWS